LGSGTAHAGARVGETLGKGLGCPDNGVITVRLGTIKVNQKRRQMSGAFVAGTAVSTAASTIAGLAAYAGPSTVTAALPAAAAPNAQSVIIVLNSRDANLSLIDGNTFTKIGIVPTGKEPHHLYPTPDGRALMVANAAGNSITVVDPITGQFKGNIPGIADPYHLALSPDFKWLLIAANRLNHVDLYSFAQTADGMPSIKLVQRWAVGLVPSHIAWSADSRHVCVSLQESDEVAGFEISSPKIAWKLKVGKQPAGMAMTPDDKYVMVGIMGEDYVDVIDWRAQKSVQKIRTGLGAHAFRALGDKRHQLVSNRAANTVSIVDMTNMAIVSEMSVPGGPDCLDVMKDQKTLLITSRWARHLSVVDVASRKVVRQVPVGVSPHGVYIHQRAGIL
jgi:YVTN family beta-propeller protein